MTNPLQRLIESLRNELQQYGEMLALLEQQRQAVLFQGANGILQYISSINSQSHIISKARDIRKMALTRLGHTLDLGDEIKFSNLIPCLPEPVRPLVTALIQENNALLLRIRQRAQQNHVCMQKTVDHMKNFIEQLGPDDTESIPLECIGPALHMNDSLADFPSAI